MDFILKNFETPVVVSKIANINYFEFTNQFHTEKDSHNFCELVYVDNGEISVSSDNYEGTLKSGELIIHRPDEMHSFLCEESNAPDIIIIGFECECEYLVPFANGPSALTPEQKKNLAEIIQEGMGVFASPYDIPCISNMEKRSAYPFGAEQMIKIKLEHLLITLIRKTTIVSDNRSIQPSGNLINVCQYIEEHFTEKILLDNLCFIFCTNKTSLCKNFKKKYGVTIGEYINNLKIKESKKMLREGTLSVTEISQKLGFTSIHYFSKLFKKSTGLSPKEYITSVKSKLDNTSMVNH